MTVALFSVNMNGHAKVLDGTTFAKTESAVNGGDTGTGTWAVKVGLAQMLKGGVIMDVVTPEQAKIAEEAGACAGKRLIWSENVAWLLDWWYGRFF